MVMRKPPARRNPGTATGIADHRRAYPTPTDTDADAHMRPAFDKRIAGMRGYEAALSRPPSLSEGCLLKFEGASGRDVFTLGEHAGDRRPALPTAAAW
jgi:hypothetical protein